MVTDSPSISVIVPVHQGAGVLPKALEALGKSDLPRERWELIVVDDASTDDSSLVAAEYADTVVRLGGKPHGPAYARNRGVESSTGDIIVFIDADTVVHQDTLRRFHELFASDPELAAAFGSYDADPPEGGIVSQYRNLLHHYMHQRNAGSAETFWAGCGAIRRDVFLEAGMFDEWHYSRPEIEDIELGRRLRQAGHRIVLDPDIQVTHLKRWTLRNVIATDFKNRGVPWMRLLLQEGPSQGTETLNIRTVEKWCTALVSAATVAGLAAALLRVPALLGLSGVAVAGVLALNYRFYRYLRRGRSLAFALAAIPLHLLYYLNNAVSVVLGAVAHTLFGAPQPPIEVETLAQVGVETWPPAPKSSSKSIWNKFGESGDR